jgi:2-polyprenyl-3-methyl-5-hydroxy-6-metoxy-1,4-benzoquinol methylase
VISEADIRDWNRNASNYSTSMSDPNETGYPDKYIWELLGDVENLHVLDIGCGDGRLCSKLSQKGAVVQGIDGSRELLIKAQEQASGIQFIEHDLSNGLPNLSQRYDIAVSIMTVMDIPDIRPLFKTVPDILSSNGRFVFSLLHPAFWNQKSILDENTGQWFKRVNGYLKEEMWRVESFGGHNHYHRSISYYVEALRAGGMVVSRMLEPAHEGISDKIPSEFMSRFPLFLMVEAKNA